MANTYWNHKGTYAAVNEALHKLIPTEGEVPNPKKNRLLEKYRKAVNCYYDYYNNGLWNRAAEFRAVFGFSGRGTVGSQATERKLEMMMDSIILAAAAEQGITLVPEVK
jgi:hypothetical protein